MLPTALDKKITIKIDLEVMKISFIYIFFSLLLINCKNNEVQKSLSYEKKEKSISITINDKTSINNKKNLNKLFYRLLEIDNEILIDTLSSIEIKGDILMDRLAMDWYLLKIKKIDTISGTVNIYIGEESQYEDDPKLYEWGEVMNNRYIYYIKRKGKYLSISNNLITEGYEDLCIDKDSIKETNLKYYIYENNE